MVVGRGALGRAVFVATQAAVMHMKSGGRVINIGSCNAERMPFTGGSVYAMSKAALVAWLAGPDSGFVTGASLTIDGGFNA